MAKRYHVAVAGSVVFHALLVYTMASIQWQASPVESIEDPAGIVWFTPPTARPADTEVTAEPASEPTSEVDPGAAPDPTPADLDPNPEALVDRNPIVEADQASERELEEQRQHTDRQRARLQITDLEFARALVIQRAKEALENAGTEHTFSLADLDRRRLFEEPRPGARGLAPTSVGRSGTQYRTAMGQTIRWINENCFQTSGPSNLFGFPAGRDIYATPVTNCTRAAQPSGDLFESIKRDYPTAAALAQPE